MTLSLAGKMIILYLCIGVVLTAAGVENVVSDAFTDENGTLTSNLQNTLPEVNEETGAVTGVLAFIDALRAVRQFIVFFGSVSLALPSVLLDLTIPNSFRLIVGVPLTVLFIIGLAQFGRSGA